MLPFVCQQYMHYKLSNTHEKPNYLKPIIYDLCTSYCVTDLPFFTLYLWILSVVKLATYR